MGSESMLYLVLRAAPPWNRVSFSVFLMPGTGRHHGNPGAFPGQGCPLTSVHRFRLSSVVGLPSSVCGELKMDYALPVTFSKVVAAIPLPMILLCCGLI